MSVEAKVKKLNLDRVVFIGRTLGEYERFFDLDTAALEGKKVLDCPAGPSSFVSEARARGIRAVGCDREYGRGTHELLATGGRDIAATLEALVKVADLYDWGYYHYIELLEEYRMLALRRFIEDYPAGLREGRYVTASLPALPFDDGAFDLVLSSHFLFAYSDRYDYGFHLESLLELVRVARGEVRVYPLVGPDARPFRALDALLAELTGTGIAAECVRVPFEFQKGSGTMLRLTK